jgi:hypothetical protein
MAVYVIRLGVNFPSGAMQMRHAANEALKSDFYVAQQRHRYALVGIHALIVNVPLCDSFFDIRDLALNVLQHEFRRGFPAQKAFNHDLGFFALLLLKFIGHVVQ